MVAAGAWWLTNRERMAADEAATQAVAVIAVTPSGIRVDLAVAVPIEWERAVLMEPYSTGEQMNAKLGFRGFPDDGWGPADEANLRP